MTLRSHWGLALILLTAVILLQGCPPGCSAGPIRSFVAQPSVICAGDSVDITWSTSADQVNLNAMPPVTPPFPTTLPTSGTESRTLAQSTLFVLQAIRDSDIFTRTVDAGVLSSTESTYSFSALGRCDEADTDNRIEDPEWTFEVLPSDWSTGVMVENVCNISADRDLEVTHDGVTESIAASPSFLPLNCTSAFSSTAIVGNWQLVITNLQGWEGCIDDRSADTPPRDIPIPSSVSLRVGAVCSP